MKHPSLTAADSQGQGLERGQPGDDEGGEGHTDALSLAVEQQRDERVPRHKEQGEDQAASGRGHSAGACPQGQSRGHRVGGQAGKLGLPQLVLCGRQEGR